MQRIVVGGIEVSKGSSLSLKSVSVLENYAKDSPVTENSGNGGGLVSQNSQSLSFENVLFERNIATKNGAAVSITSCNTVNILASKFNYLNSSSSIG